MIPELLDLGLIKINGYGMMIGIGAIFSFIALNHESRRLGLDSLTKNLMPLIVIGALAAFVGGRVLFMLMYPEINARNLEQHGFMGSLGMGFVFYGSLLTAVPVVLWRLRNLGVPVRKSFDVFILAGPIVHGFGRLGCFLAGCCYGCRTDSTLAVTFPQGMGLIGVPIHPVQLYEACGELLIFFFLWFGPRLHRKFDGQVTLTYLLLYSCLRFVTEFLRGDGNPLVFSQADHVHTAGDAPAAITSPQLTSFLIFALALALLISGIRRYRLMNT